MRLATRNFFKAVVIPLAILVYWREAEGQSMVIDGLKKKLWQAHTEKEKLDCYFLLFTEKATLPADTLLTYALAAKEIAQRMGDELKLMDAKYMVLSAYQKLGMNDTCLFMIDQCMEKKFEDPAFRHIQRKYWLYRGFIMNVMNDSKKAQQTLFDLLHEAEAEQDKYIQVSTLNLIGWSYLNLNNDSVALYWFHKAIALLPTDESRQYAELRNNLKSNLAITFWQNYRRLKTDWQLDSAIYYTRESAEESRKHQFLSVLAFNLGNLSLMIYERDKNNVLAEQLLKEALMLRQQIGDLYYVIMDMAKMGEYYLNSNQYSKGIEICNQAIYKADSAKIKSDILWLYELLAKNFKAAGRFREYGDALYALDLYKDSMNKENASRELFDIQTRYEVQKKEATIANQKLKIIQRNLLVFGSVALLFALAIAGWIGFKRYHRRQKLKMESSINNERKMTEFAVKEAEEKERKRIAADLHDQLGVQANAILYKTELLQQVGFSSEAAISDLHDTAKEMLLHLRHTLWVMKTTEIMASDLWRRIISFCLQMKRHYEQIVFTTEGGAPAGLVMSSAKALNIVMMVQEAVNNAVKHAGAGQIRILGSEKENKWQICISDDGAGFVVSDAYEKQDSNGLRNMEDRARASGLLFAIYSAPGEGTTVHIEI